MISHTTRSPARWTIAAFLLVSSSICLAQHDPGVRGGPPGAGKPLDGLTPIELSVFREGLQRSIQLEGVCDSCTDLTLGAPVDPAEANVLTQTNSSGLGTRFNGDQCTACHNHPALGGSGGFMIPNPQEPLIERLALTDPIRVNTLRREISHDAEWSQGTD